ncbi:MAG TPA: glycosyltransferase family 39 protein, partial [Humisphaera sp.]|nr:glycosyltransferase family 39 protein [Humisphaera sp.]
MNDPARQFVQTGEFRSRVFSDVPGFEHGYLWQPPAHTCVAIAAYRIFGFGIWQTRIPPLLFGAGSVFLVYCVTWRISRNTRAAVLASLLWALQPGFIQMVRSGRMDAQCIFFVVLSTLLAIRAIQSFSSLIGYAVAGLAGGIGITTHPIALFWAAGIGLMLLAARRGKWLPAIAFAVGAALPVAGWLGYASERLDVFRAQFLNHAGHMVASGTVATRTVAEISKYFITYPLVLPEFLVLLGSLAYFGFQSRVSAQIRFGMMAIVALLFLPGPVFKLNVSVFRFMHPVVIFCITGGMMLSD